jgi:cobalamin biosynthesis protein CbiG
LKGNSCSKNVTYCVLTVSENEKKEKNSHLFVPVAGAFWINYQRVSTAQRIHALVKRAFLRLRIPETSHKSIATINVNCV